MSVSRFERYLRFGLVEHDDSIEAKFNPYHDQLGRFTNASGSTGPSNRRTRQTHPNVRALTARTNYAQQAAKGPQNLRHDRSASEIAGFPQDGSRAWRASNDDTFAAAADFYNRKYGLKPGDSDYATPQFLKAWAMRESGGEGNRSAFQTDPFQVNNPGDWSPEKVRIAGLKRGQKMTPATSAYAALEWLRHKSLIRDSRGQIVGRRNRLRSLQRYNGRSDHSRQSGLRAHGEWYAETILEMTARAERRHP